MAIASAEAHLAGNQPLAEPQALFFTDRREWEAYVLKAAVVPLSLISFETTPANMELALSASRSDGSGCRGWYTGVCCARSPQPLREKIDSS
jgi:hypothetical protein